MKRNIVLTPKKNALTAEDIRHVQSLARERLDRLALCQSRQPLADFIQAAAEVWIEEGRLAAVDRGDFSAMTQEERLRCVRAM